MFIFKMTGCRTCGQECEINPKTKLPYVFCNYHLQMKNMRQQRKRASLREDVPPINHSNMVPSPSASHNEEKIVLEERNVSNPFDEEFIKIKRQKLQQDKARACVNHMTKTVEDRVAQQWTEIEKKVKTDYWLQPEECEFYKQLILEGKSNPEMIDAAVTRLRYPEKALQYHMNSEAGFDFSSYHFLSDTYKNPISSQNLVSLRFGREISLLMVCDRFNARGFLIQWRKLMLVRLNGEYQVYVECSFESKNYGVDSPKIFSTTICIPAGAFLINYWKNEGRFSGRDPRASFEKTLNRLLRQSQKQILSSLYPHGYLEHQKALEDANLLFETLVVNDWQPTPETRLFIQDTLLQFKQDWTAENEPIIFSRSEMT